MWNEGQNAGRGACDVCGVFTGRVWHKNNKGKWKETCQSCMAGIRSQQTYSSWLSNEDEDEGKGKGEGKGGASSSTGDYSQNEYDMGYYAGVDHMMELLIDLLGQMEGKGKGKGKGKGNDDDEGERRSRSRSRTDRH